MGEHSNLYSPQIVQSISVFFFNLEGKCMGASRIFGQWGLRGGGGGWGCKDPIASPGGLYQGSFMRTKHLFVLIHIRNKGEVGTMN